MSDNVILRFPEEMTYRKALLLTDALLVGDTADLTKEKPEYVLLEDLRQFLTYKIEENEDGFLTGSDRKFVLDKLKKLGFGSVSNVDNVPDYRGRLSDLLGVGKVELNTLRYNCVYAAKDVKDFPPDLYEIDSGGFVFTNRNGDKGVQFVLGSESGRMYSRRKVGKVVTGWSTPQESGVFHVWFEVNEETGELIVGTIPDNSGISFTAENGYLVVEF